MKSMSRKFGGLTASKSADEADVGQILHEFKVADELLDTLLNDLTAFRNAWDQILTLQTTLSGTLVELYEPVEVDEITARHHVPSDTPQKYLDKCHGLQAAYQHEQADLGQEIGMLTQKLVKIAEDAKLHSTPLKRTIKHRENMKLDYERYLDKAEKGRRKELRNQKEEMALARNESELAQSRINYQTADEHVKENFPGVTELIYSLLPYLLTNVVMLQTTLVGQMYTVLDEYTRDQGLPNPAPNDRDIVSVWDKEYTFLRKELETSLQIVAGGKTVHMPMVIPQKDKGPGSAGLGIRPKAIAGRRQQADPPGMQHAPRQIMAAQPDPAGMQLTTRPLMARKSSSIHPDEDIPPAKPVRPNAAASLAAPQPNWKARTISNGSAASFGAPLPYDTKSSALVSDWQSRRSLQLDQASAGASPNSQYHTPTQHSPLPSSASTVGTDYFDNRRASASSSIASAAAAVAAKKKPPPPVPAKRVNNASAQYVTALFDFDAQNHGDLAFKEGDKIKVVKKTGSTDDWWEGELNGRSGSFPANYVQT